MALEFEGDVLRTERALEAFDLGSGLFGREGLGERTVMTSREADPIASELCQLFGPRKRGLIFGDAKLGSGDEAAEVLIAALGDREQGVACSVGAGDISSNVSGGTGLEHR